MKKNYCPTFEPAENHLYISNILVKVDFVDGIIFILKENISEI